VTEQKPNRTQVEKDAVQAVKKIEAIQAAVSTPAKGDYVLYVTAKKENSAFTIRAGNVEIRGQRDSTKDYILFRVPHDVAKNFEAHTFCRTGRIIKAK